ncbi:hypothetical protein HVPorG_04248 [Roseomonas mucosa]|uniref:Uncharacterized protein n=1 Tax=Roseomonas mucosa TaxID=207340 RepID=A0A4Y1MX68_9PROT|nr:hypothetical protein RADP37_04248 [Roseomonas mucosa]QDJ09523.1 hypothetical protein HVPorG_04248 [Roseomonas mucosa]
MAPDLPQAAVMPAAGAEPEPGASGPRRLEAAGPPHKSPGRKGTA